MVHGKADYLVAAMWLCLVGVAVVAMLWFTTRSALTAGIPGLLFQAACTALWIAEAIRWADQDIEK